MRRNRSVMWACFSFAVVSVPVIVASLTIVPTTAVQDTTRPVIQAHVSPRLLAHRARARLHRDDQIMNANSTARSAVGGGHVVSLSKQFSHGLNVWDVHVAFHGALWDVKLTPADAVLAKTPLTS